MRIAAIPGFEFTGEFREPQAGEWFWTGADAMQVVSWAKPNQRSARLILRKLRSTDLGDYELTGEWRRPTKDEPYARGAGNVSTVSFGPFVAIDPLEDRFHILREKRSGSAGEGAG